MSYLNIVVGLKFFNLNFFPALFKIFTQAFSLSLYVSVLFSAILKEEYRSKGEHYGIKKTF